MNESEKSKVQDLNDRLDSRTRYENPNDVRSTVREIETPEVEEKWQGSTELDTLLSRERMAPETSPFMKKFFVFAALFFVATVIIAGVVFFGGVNFVSSKNVDINVVGPTLTSAGQPLELGVTIENQNNTDLESVNFSVQYPQGSRNATDTSQTLTYVKENLGVVEAGKEVVRNIRFVLIGAAGETRQVKFSVEYKVKGSNATFYKDKVYDLSIGNAPVSIKIESPKDVTAGEIFSTKLTLQLNSNEVLKNVMLRADYPYGYTMSESTPDPVSSDNVWSLGDMAAGSTKTINIKGKLIGEDQDERTFRFYLGVSDNGGVNPNFKTIIVSDQQTVGIDRPNVGLNISLNGESASSYVAPAGRSISTSIRYQNNLSEKLLNPKLEVRLSGVALDKSSVIVQNGGEYNGSSNRINWNIINSQGLAELSPGEGGSVLFSLASLSNLLGNSGQEIGLQFILTGTPVGGGPAVSVTETRTVKIASQVTLASAATYSIGSFANTGPIPPKAEQTTSYTIHWSMGNTQGDIANGKVTAKLGTNVEWLIAKSVASEDISYDEKTHTVTWNLGQLMQGTGFSTAEREVSFQVALTPSTSQVGIAPVLVSNIIFSGQEIATNKTITINNQSLTTKLPTDPAFIQGDDIVVK
jgi:hypothetical protein